MYPTIRLKYPIHTPGVPQAMVKPSLTDTLLELASAKETRSQAARLRDVYVEVEHALQHGVSRKAVLAALQADGFTMSMKMFDKALYRIRKKKTLDARPVQQPPSAPPSKATTGAAESKNTTATRVDIKKISQQYDDMDLNALVAGRSSKKP